MRSHARLAHSLARPTRSLARTPDSLTHSLALRAWLARQPVAGYVKSILVSTAETVEVGKVVAVITQGEARGTVESTPETAVEERRETSSRSKAASAASVDERDLAAARKNMERVFGNEADHIGALGANGLGNSNGHGGHRAHRAHRPSISFPTRRTADGRMISELPASDQARIRAEELSNVHSKSFFLRANAAINGGATRGSPVLHRAMSDREMELVMLGGAE